MSKNMQHNVRAAVAPAIIIGAYTEAFGKHYPQHAVEVKKGKSRDGVAMYNVHINGDKGDRPMTLGELREATQAFLH